MFHDIRPPRTALAVWMVLAWVCAVWAQGDPATSASSARQTETREVVCAGTYGGHLQGIAADDQHIYWSHTVQLVKTDLTGKVLQRIDVPDHHGDLTCVNGKLFVAVEFGSFNQPAGKSDPWVFVYSTDRLALIAQYRVPELIHGSGGIAHHDGLFVVVGGLPAGHEVNFVFTYDKHFNFLRRYVIRSGFTNLGIQTATYFNDHWWFGCYGSPKNPGLLQVNREFQLVGRAACDFSYGIEPFDGGSLLRGECFANNKRGRAILVRNVENVVHTGTD